LDCDSSSDHRSEIYFWISSCCCVVHDFSTSIDLLHHRGDDLSHYVESDPPETQSHGFGILSDHDQRLRKCLVAVMGRRGLLQQRCESSCHHHFQNPPVEMIPHPEMVTEA
jgi:hypothetical protein